MINKSKNEKKHYIYNASEILVALCNAVLKKRILDWKILSGIISQNINKKSSLKQRKFIGMVKILQTVVKKKNKVELQGKGDRVEKAEGGFIFS